jgi:hypothetical protein
MMRTLVSPSEDEGRPWEAANVAAFERDLRKALEESRADYAAGRVYRSREELAAAVAEKRARRG